MDSEKVPKIRLDVLLAEYDQASQAHRTLIDIRFKLLAFVPAITGVSIAILKDHIDASLGVAIFGFLVTVGIVIYEIRNSQLHDVAAHRVKTLQDWLGIAQAGLSAPRPPRQRLFFVVSVWHDRALGIVYGASTGAWAALIVYASSEWARQNLWLSAIVATLVFLVFYEEIIRINNRTGRSIGDVPALPEITDESIKAPALSSEQAARILNPPQPGP